MVTKKRSAATAGTPVKKSPAKKAPVKKAPLKKTTVKKPPAVEVKAMPKKTAAQPAAAVAKMPGDIAKQAAKKIKKDHKIKVVRDSFTMPHSEYQKIAEIKETCLKAGLHVKKSEVLRAGLKVLCELKAAQITQSLGSLEKIQTGRPKKNKH